MAPNVCITKSYNNMRLIISFSGVSGGINGPEELLVSHELFCIWIGEWMVCLRSERPLNMLHFLNVDFSCLCPILWKSLKPNFHAVLQKNLFLAQTFSHFFKYHCLSWSVLIGCPCAAICFFFKGTRQMQLFLCWN